MRNHSSGEDAHRYHERPRPIPALLTATAVVIIGTALVDAVRLWLLLVPASFLLAAFAAGALVDRAVGGRRPMPDRPPTLSLAVRLGVGLACFSLLTVASAFAGVLWVAVAAAVPLLAYGLLPAASYVDLPGWWLGCGPRSRLPFSTSCPTIWLLLNALASVAPWWVRAFVHTGNPIYPMGFTLLGGRP